MKAKLHQKKPTIIKDEEQENEEQELINEEEQIQDEEPQEEEEEQQQISFVPKMLKKNSLFVTFTGLIESGYFDEFKELNLYYLFSAGPDWKRVCGKKQGLTQIATRKNQQIVWNYPIDITFETTVLTGWPQIIVVIYGRNFFGYRQVEGYGNRQLPVTPGMQQRKLRVFCPLPQSVISGIFGYISGKMAEYRNIEKTLANGDGREVTRTKSIGSVTMKLQTTRYNFQKFGYQ